jgi:hypothetical protein
MIRVNLIGSRGSTASKGKRPMQLPTIPNVGILLAVLILVAQTAALYVWSDSVGTEADQYNSKLVRLQAELDELTKTKEAITELQTEVDKLQSTEGLFETLFADKRGPVEALSYLSFILLDRDEAATPSDELRAMEAAGWRVSWVAHRAWFNSFRELAGEVTLNGEAMDHQDVAEVQRRLESSPYFRECRIVYQDKKRDETLGITYVEFSIRASLIYLIEPAVPAVPEAAAAGAPDADATGGDGGADATDGDADHDGTDLAAEVTPVVPDVYFPKMTVEVVAGEGDDAGTDGDVPGTDDAAQADARAKKSAEPDEKAPAKDEPVVPKAAPAPEGPPRLGAPPATDDLPPPGRGALPQAPTGGAPPAAEQTGDRPTAE